MRTTEYNHAQGSQFLMDQTESDLNVTEKPMRNNDSNNKIVDDAGKEATETLLSENNQANNYHLEEDEETPRGTASDRIQF